VIVTPLAPAARAAPTHAAQRWAVGIGGRGLILLGLGLIWTVPAWWEPRALVLMAMWDVALLAAWLQDLRRLPAPTDLEVTRSWSGALGLGVPSRVTLAMANKSAEAIDVQLLDTPAEVLRRDLPTLAVSLPAGGSAEAGYEVMPGERGDADVGDVVVRYQSGWGLAVRWTRANLTQTVRVYPDLRDAQRLALALIRSQQLEIEKRRVRRRGMGREFESLRDFRDGDELRDVCWTATARRGRLVSKVYQPERSQAVWLVIDAGRLSRARIAGHRKLDHAANAAVALAQVAMLSGDRVGLFAYGRQPQQRVAPGRGTPHLRTLVEALAAVRGEAVEGNHLSAAASLLSLQSRRALIVWLTEIAETAGVPDVIEGGQQMAGRHVVLLAVPRSTELLALAETDPTSTDRMYQVMAAQQTAERREALIHSLRQRGVMALEWTPGHLSAALVDRYLQVKERSLV